MRYIIIICCFTFCSAQVFSQYDYTGSRSTAMSGAVTSGPGGSWSIYHNPAQLANFSWPMYINYFDQLDLSLTIIF